ncbi:hypothetical protein BHE74_00014821 [Ensete ventricosum]|nr:hypothetical protein BHE74_00014821 [Ensete ventricosum]
MGETEYPDHNDALVVLVRIANAKVKRVMIDTRSSINVLYFDAFHKLGLTTIDLSPMSTTLIGFTGDFIAPLGMIILLVIIEQEPRSKTMMVTFMVVNFSSAYNIILSRSILNKFRELHLSSGDEVLDPSKDQKGEKQPSRVQAMVPNYYHIAKEVEVQSFELEEGRAVAITFQPAFDRPLRGV